MAKDFNIWKTRSKPFGSPLKSTTFAAFEKKHHIRLPKAFKELYQIQNGGHLQDIESPEFLLPLGKSKHRMIGEQIGPLSGWSQYGETTDELKLDAVREEIGNPEKIFPLCTGDGHVFHALNYNGVRSGREPTVIRIDFEGVHGETVAPSFGEWIRQLAASDTDCPINWEEHKQNTVLFQEAITFKHRGKEPIEWESILCHEHYRGKNRLVLFKRCREGNHITHIERISTPKCVINVHTRIQDCDMNQKPKGNRVFELGLEAIDSPKNEWVMANRTSKGTWKTEKDRGGYARFELRSNSLTKLQTLINTLRGAGLVREDPPSKDFYEIFSPKFQENILRDFYRSLGIKRPPANSGKFIP